MNYILDDLEIEDEYYCYPGTKTLKNKLNIKDEDLLSEAEREIVAIKFTDLYQNPIKGNFDFQHYKDIHKRLFIDLYDFAGQTRNCDIFKHNYFCLSKYIYSYSQDIFANLKNKTYFLDYDYEEKIELLATLYSDLNALHPFREGNGRVLREFIEQLAKINAIDLDLSNINKKELIKASMESFVTKNSNLIKIFNDNSSSLSKIEQIGAIDTYCTYNLANYLKTKILKRNKSRR